MKSDNEKKKQIAQDLKKALSRAQGDSSDFFDWLAAGYCSMGPDAVNSFIDAIDAACGTSTEPPPLSEREFQNILM